MKGKSTRAARWLALALVAALAAGCGGGGGGGSSNDDGLSQAERENRSASSSIEGLLAFGKAMIASMSESDDARSMSGVNPPTDDTIEPSTL